MNKSNTNNAPARAADISKTDTKAANAMLPKAGEAGARVGPDDSDAMPDYAAVRYNAIKHGILSRLVVLPHEAGDEFAALLDALVDEHHPSGPTEMHLVEELAALMWRQRRVLMAEGSAINQGLYSVTHDIQNSAIAAATPFDCGWSNEDSNLPDLVSATEEVVAQLQQDAVADLDATGKAAAILRKGGVGAYDRARRALLADSRDWWDEHVEKALYSATVDGLAAFIWETLLPTCIRMEREARIQPSVKAQTLGEGLQAHRLEKLNRYETHLDRKFERTLSMLLKLKQLSCY